MDLLSAAQTAEWSRICSLATNKNTFDEFVVLLAEFWRDYIPRCTPADISEKLEASGSRVVLVAYPRTPTYVGRTFDTFQEDGLPNRFEIHPEMTLELRKDIHAMWRHKKNARNALENSGFVSMSPYDEHV